MEKNDYEALRQRNISERNNVLAKLFGDIKKENKIKKLEGKQSYRNVDVENYPPRKRRRTITEDTENFSGKGINLQFRRTYNIRSRKNASKDEFNDSKSDNEENDSTKHKNNRAKLTVMFPWAKPIQRPIDLMNMEAWDESEEEDNHNLIETKRKRTYQKTKSIRESIPSVDEVTQDMLDNVAERSIQKTYCKVNGTCCHQCRQKTMDTKTICRSEDCIGLRGNFCGPCLQGRYGESVIEALKDPNWICPPCRDLCNCSICRTKSGRRPTGILVGIAKKEGYSSVMDYLQANSDDSE